MVRKHKKRKKVLKVATTYGRKDIRKRKKANEIKAEIAKRMNKKLQTKKMQERKNLRRKLENVMWQI